MSPINIGLNFKFKIHILAKWDFVLDIKSVKIYLDTVLGMFWRYLGKIFLGSETLKKLSLAKVPPDEIQLTKHLVKKK